MNLLKKFFIVIFVLLAFFAGFTFVKDIRRPQDRVQIVVDQAFEDGIFTLINEQRVKGGLKSLVRNVQLDKSAELKLQDMLNKQYWDHYDPEGNPPWKFFEEAGYEYNFAGENLARDYISPDSFVSGWMGSSKHKENIMNPNFTESGIVVVVGEMDGFETVIAVQHFGSPLSD